ncbi:MAG: hypothetical protein IJO62_04025 [Clostridia bacterium]|nr:hypothetical protein [Clostridia bacterium]
MQKKRFNWWLCLPFLALIAVILSIAIYAFLNQAPAERTDVKIYTNGNLLTDGYDNFKEYSADKTSPDSDGMPNYIDASNTAVGNVTQKENSYCGNKNSKVYHRLSCSSLQKTKDENKVYFTSKNECENNGYKPCSRCKP